MLIQFPCILSLNDVLQYDGRNKEINSEMNTESEKITGITSSVGWLDKRESASDIRHEKLSDDLESATKLGEKFSA